MNDYIERKTIDEFRQKNPDFKVDISRLRVLVGKDTDGKPVTKLCMMGESKVDQGMPITLEDNIPLDILREILVFDSWSEEQADGTEVVRQGFTKLNHGALYGVAADGSHMDETDAKNVKTSLGLNPQNDMCMIENLSPQFLDVKMRDGDFDLVTAFDRVDERMGYSLSREGTSVFGSDKVTNEEKGKLNLEQAFALNTGIGELTADKARAKDAMPQKFWDKARNRVSAIKKAIADFKDKHIGTTTRGSVGINQYHASPTPN